MISSEECRIPVNTEDTAVRLHYTQVGFFLFWIGKTSQHLALKPQCGAMCFQRLGLDTHFKSY